MPHKTQKGVLKIKDFKISLAAARVNSGLTQQDIADIMKVSKNTIINWEKGRISLKPAQFEKLCREYNIDKDYIFLP